VNQFAELVNLLFQGLLRQFGVEFGFHLVNEERTRFLKHLVEFRDLHLSNCINNLASQSVFRFVHKKRVAVTFPPFSWIWPLFNRAEAGQGG
jgi:hypothetical protein